MGAVKREQRRRSAAVHGDAENRAVDRWRRHPAVIPYRVEPLSIKLPPGLSPWVPSNENSVVGVPPPTGMLKTVPSLLVPPTSVIP